MNTEPRTIADLQVDGALFCGSRFKVHRHKVREGLIDILGISPVYYMIADAEKVDDVTGGPAIVAQGPKLSTLIREISARLPNPIVDDAGNLLDGEE